MIEEDLTLFMSASVKLVDTALRELLPSLDSPEQTLHEAMHYSVFAGGKRLRPILFLLVADACSLDYETVLPAACALEMIHTYSLIHDDLPALDNDDYRRGVLTNHKVYGEATAILAGDALLTHAFETLLRCSLPPAQLVRMVQEVAQASGVTGMVGGQMGDLLAENSVIDASALEFIHVRKTGALLTVSGRLPVIAANLSEEILTAITIYAQSIGLAFQIQDDILDVIGDAEVLGKSTGADHKHSKSTYPALLGLQNSKDLVQSLTERAHSAIANVPGVLPVRLHSFAEYLRNRDH